MRLLIPCLFTRYGLEAVTATCRRENEPSARLLQRLGMRLVRETADELFFRLDRSGPPAA